MIFTPTALPGLMLVGATRSEDERGSFTRTWCRREFEAHGLNAPPVQISISSSRLKGTVRGMHFQRAPHAETKLVRCIEGAIFDVAIDLRPGSPTRGQWLGFELTPQNGLALAIPEGFAHGLQTLLPDTEVLYQISAFHEPESLGGVRWNDPAFAIPWPLALSAISARDAAWPDYQP
ncbi:MAG TPA: dTDP-4-dehydrorhamnose 3,5-epimerase [Stellaceae bacterium]|nr:dTDP-4-dehydrorhamnose 3,5-epimerase [Stellaceae bacterium]